MRDFNAKWKRIEDSQNVLNYAWGFLLCGMGSTILGMLLGLNPFGPFGVWLAFCGVAGVGSLVGSVTVAFRPLK